MNSVHRLTIDGRTVSRGHGVRLPESHRAVRIDGGRVRDAGPAADLVERCRAAAAPSGAPTG